MKETIYTIPLTDAFNAGDECPFCFIERKLERDMIAFILGSSYMEDDFRARTDRSGFCRYHHRMMYDYGNKLGIALILQSYYEKLCKDFAAYGDDYLANHLSAKKSDRKLFFKTAKSSPKIVNWLQGKTQSCYICHQLNERFVRYVDTFYDLIINDSSFLDLVTNSKGFCLSHFNILFEQGTKKLTNKQKASVMPLLLNLMTNHLDRIKNDIDWFVDKYDYRNRDAGWKSSKDAVQRGLQKLSGGYPEDAPFKS